MTMTLRSAPGARGSLQALGDERVGVLLAVEQVRFDGREEGIRVGIAPAQAHPARRGRCLQPGHLGLDLGMFAEVEVDEVALAEGLVGGPSAAIVQARTAPAGLVPSLSFGIGHRLQDVVAVDAEHQPVVVAGQDGAGAPGGTKDLRHAVGLDAARQIHHVAQDECRARPGGAAAPIRASGGRTAPARAAAGSLRHRHRPRCRCRAADGRWTGAPACRPRRRRAWSASGSVHATTWVPAAALPAARNRHIRPGPARRSGPRRRPGHGLQWRHGRKAGLSVLPW